MYKNIFYSLVALSMLTGCFTNPIDLDLNEGDPQIAITGWITDADIPQFITVSRSTNFLGPQTIDYIGGAEAQISDEMDTYILEEREIGRYYLPEGWVANIGQTYRLEVIYQGVTYTASHLMRESPVIQNPTFEENTSQDDTITYYQALISFDDPVGEGDGYFVIDYKKGTVVDDFIERGFVGDDEFVDGEFIEDVITTNYDYRYVIGDTVMIELYSIGEETNAYIEEVRTESFRGDSPFESPPVNVSTNISGGALGYFIASGRQQVEIVIQ